MPSSSEIDRLSHCLNQWGPMSIAAAADPTSPTRDLSRIAYVAAITTGGAVALVAAAGQRQELPIEASPPAASSSSGVAALEASRWPVGVDPPPPGTRPLSAGAGRGPGPDCRDPRPS